MRAILACSALVLSVFATSTTLAGDASAELGKPAPAFELSGLDGKTFKLSDFKDKIVVLEWWNKDCPVCLKYMPTMNKLASRYAEKGVVWLGIDSTHYQSADKLREFASQEKITYPILSDADGTVGKTYGAKTTPHMFVINKGVLVYDGAIDDKADRSYIDEALTALLAGESVPLAKTQPFGCSVKYAKGVAGKSDVAAKQAKADPAVAEVGKPAPGFKLIGSDGKTHGLSDYGDKVVVLEWWNKDCPVCRKYVPTMKKMAADYGEKGVVWLGIDSTHYQKAAAVQEYLGSEAIRYPVLMDTDGKIGRKYRARTTPHMFVINKGVLVYDGAIDNKGDRNYVGEALDAVLAGKDVPLANTQPFGCSVKYKK